MANLIETQRVYKILKKVIKKMGDKNIYVSPLYTVHKIDNMYMIQSKIDISKFMKIVHDDRSVSWSVPKGVSVLSIQQAVS